MAAGNGPVTSPENGASSQTYRKLLRLARSDPDILGVILSGSRGAGQATPLSDFDVQVVVRDSAVRAVRRRIGRPPKGLDLWVRSKTSFESPTDNRPQTEGYGPMYAHVAVPVDKTGRIALMAARKARIPRAAIRAYTSVQLDAYLNELLRSLKCFRNGQTFAGHLEATRSLPYLLETLFGSEGRWAPYAKYLERELRNYPLRRSPISAGRLLGLMERILRDGNPGAQRTVFRAVERSFRLRGYGRVFDSWETSQLRLMKSP